ncbi:unnamed protein product [Cercopithifilaria johnstoni]|uniref:Uncharacterized protein n=1 Tax=Cercopithifilaria johnstoni TaxID=2874296 RepID=A0A8J2PZS3_9BILA|nr:unnamed protein product [Cercopithifilaria johnstoni]
MEMMEWNGMERNGMEWDGMERNGTEWNGMGWDGMGWDGCGVSFQTYASNLELQRSLNLNECKQIQMKDNPVNWC